MKKTYISPETKTFRMETAQMVMTSITSVSVKSDAYEEGSMTDLSRKSSIWDEEE